MNGSSSSRPAFNREPTFSAIDAIERVVPMASPSEETAPTRIVIADDNPVIRRLVGATVADLHCDVVVCCDGTQAWQTLSETDAPALAILNWVMPGMDGVEVIRKTRSSSRSAPLYIILLTAKGQRESIVEGLRAGADDYVVKPFDYDELRARVRVGERVIALERRSRDRVKELEKVLASVSQLQGMLPICCYCKKIRDDQNYWEQVESYVSKHSEARFSHSVCPDCHALYVKRSLDD